MKLIEARFPLAEVNALAEYEMSFKMTPRGVTELLRVVSGVDRARAAPEIKVKINSLFSYPARIPPSAARPVTLASLAGSEIDVKLLLEASGMNRLAEFAKKTGKFPTLFMVEPERELVEKIIGRKPADLVVVDPIAGGGSIPLEAKRLGFTVIAGDYNPVAYLLLRATVEFPAKYGAKLYELVNSEAKRLIEYVRRELGRFYLEDAKGMIYVLSADHGCGLAVPLIREASLYRGGRRSIYISWEFDKEGKRLEAEVLEDPVRIEAWAGLCPRPSGGQYCWNHI